MCRTTQWVSSLDMPDIDGVDKITISRSHERASLAVNSAPLSDRMYAGSPRCRIRSGSTISAPIRRSERSTRAAKHFRVNSPTIFGSFSGRPSSVR